YDTLNQLTKINILFLRRRKLGKSRVGLEKTTERIGAGGDGIQSRTRIIFPIRWERIAPQKRFQTCREGFNRSQRVVHFMPEAPHDPLPGATFFFAQRSTKVS